MSIRLRLVFWLTKLLQVVIKKLGRGGGMALPGLVAQRLAPQLLSTLSGQVGGVIVVAGTNGKTTTSRLIASYIEGSEQTIIHNRSGSNLIRGITSALVANASWSGQITADWGVFEVDEAVLGQVVELVQPNHVVALNLFRDQLDRYGEVDAIAAKWKKAVAHLDSSATLILNADDPLIASLGQSTQAQVVYFGLDVQKAIQEIPRYADSRRCPQCGSLLIFDQLAYSHLGHYYCPKGDFNRPDPAVKADQIHLRGMDGADFAINSTDQVWQFHLGLAGLYNVYNVTAAVTVAQQLGLEMSMVQTKTEHFEAVFGRLEQVQIGAVELTLVLVKNPTGYNQVIQTLLSDAGAGSFWLLLNDRFADGRDVSWIWDVELERLAHQVEVAVIGGTRAYDMALRCKYAGWSEPQLMVYPSLSDGLRAILALKQPKIYCLCTYTAMLQLRQQLQKQRAVISYHNL